MTYMIHSPARPVHSSLGMSSVQGPVDQAAPSVLTKVQQAVGNRVVSQYLLSRSAPRYSVGDIHSVNERQATELAAQDAPSHSKPATLGSKPVGNRGKEPALPTAWTTALDRLRGQERGLDHRVLTAMEQNLGEDFSGIRIHTGSRASSLAEYLNASAFTVGQDIYFGSGAFDPDSAQGRQLLTHELVHTVQNRSPTGESQSNLAASPGPAVIQRQQKPHKTKPPQTAAPKATPGPELVSIQSFLPFQVGDHVNLFRILDTATMAVLDRYQAETAAGLRAVHQRTAEVTTATPELFEATVVGTVQVPAAGKQPARSLTNLTFRVQRRSNGHFDIELTGTTDDDKKDLELLFVEPDLEANVSGRVIVFSRDGERRLKMLQSKEGERIILKAFTGAYIKDSDLSEWAKTKIRAGQART